MRRLDVDLKKKMNQIRAFSPGRILINHEEYTGSLLLTPTQIIAWAVSSFTDLTVSSLQTIIDLKPDVLLLGTGAFHHFITQDINQHLLDHHIGVEVMSTHAACRTFNALSLDGRHVLAALIIN